MSDRNKEMWGKVFHSPIDGFNSLMRTPNEIENIYSKVVREKDEREKRRKLYENEPETVPDSVYTEAPPRMNSKNGDKVPVTAEVSNNVHSIKNGNPLNIRDSKDNWQGMKGVDKNTNFVQFDNFNDGLRAGIKTIQTNRNKRKNNTIEKLIKRWAPESDGNNTKEYIKTVAKEAGIPANEVIKDENMFDIIKAMIKVEGGRDALKYYTDDMIKKELDKILNTK
jgi:hypothetical protein